MRKGAVLAVLLSATIASCATAVPTTDRGVLVSENLAGNVTLDISNQDRSVDPLDVRVFLDGVPIIRAKIAIGEVHPSYERYRFDWTPGSHEIRVESATVPAELVAPVEIKGKLFIYVLYGYPPQANEFLLKVHDEPLAWL